MRWERLGRKVALDVALGLNYLHSQVGASGGLRPHVCAQLRASCMHVHMCSVSACACACACVHASARVCLRLPVNTGAGSFAPPRAPAPAPRDRRAPHTLGTPPCPSTAAAHDAPRPEEPQRAAVRGGGGQDRRRGHGPQPGEGRGGSTCQRWPGGCRETPGRGVPGCPRGLGCAVQGWCASLGGRRAKASWRRVARRRPGAAARAWHTSLRHPPAPPGARLRTW